MKFFESAFPRYFFIPLLAACIVLLPNAAAGQFDVRAVSLDTVRMNRFLEAEARRVREAAWERINSQDKLDRQRQTLLAEFRFMIGLEPSPERTPLEATLVRTIERKDYTVEVIHFQSLPGFYVTANLYRPRKGRAPFPAVIWGPGHGGGEYGTKTNLQPHAALWARAGYICLVVDPIQAAEVYGIHHGLAGYGLRDWYSRGYTPIGIEVWNAMRAADYLISRPDVDGNKLTITGVSGGGHLSWMAGAADPRLSVVQPAAGTADVFTHIQRNLQGMHCDCAYFVNAYRHDWPTLAALISPRPFLMHNSTGDAYYPPEGYTAVLAKAKEIYGWYGVADKVDMDEVPGPHGYYPPQRQKAVDWSNLWLFGRKTQVKERPVEEIPVEQLGALGGVHAVHPENINAHIQEILIPTARLEPFNSRSAWDAKRTEILKNLREVVFRNLPAKVEPQRKSQGDSDAYVLETEPGVEVGMVSHVPPAEGGIKAAVLYVASPGDVWNDVVWGFMKPFPLSEKPTSKHVIYPRGIGGGLWDGPTRQRIERDALILGRTLDDLRLYDILCAIESVCKDPSFAGAEELTLVGKGESAGLAAYAAILDQRVTRVVLHSPPVTHRNGPHFLNVLRYTDIPQALALLAPRCELVFLTHEYDDFGYTKSIYELLGAGDKFRRCVSVTQALNLKQ
ncbi:MAG TPA: CocE/NonD family hydrolase [Candidatus Glassbacteria bacterium]|nr:CocE/NonD family hydrolase [Candidatus Glassbacteria bacterium]